VDEWLYNVVNGKPFNWRPLKVLGCVLLYLGLVAAAIYELVYW